LIDPLRSDNGIEQMQFLGAHVNHTDCHQRGRGDVISQHRKKELDVDIAFTDTKKARLRSRLGGVLHKTPFQDVKVFELNQNKNIAHTNTDWQLNLKRD
jgi:hypothetical protein